MYSFSQVADEYIADKENYIKISSGQQYQGQVNLFKKEFNTLDITSITTDQLQNFINNKAKHLAQETIISYSKVLKQIFQYAMGKEYININPYDKLKHPRGCRQRKEVEIFSLSEIDKLMSIQCPEYKKYIIQIGFRTGLRIGEVLALKWKDINLSANTLVVNRTLACYKNGKPVINSPKTKSSKRVVGLDTILVSLLDCLQRNEKVGDFVFCKANGLPYSRQAIRIGALCDKAKIRRRSFHSLRHTHATTLLSAGINPVAVQLRLGHKDIAVTLGIYGHYIPVDQDKIINIYNQIPANLPKNWYLNERKAA